MPPRSTTPGGWRSRQTVRPRRCAAACCDAWRPGHAPTTPRASRGRRRRPAGHRPAIPPPAPVPLARCGRSPGRTRRPGRSRGRPVRCGSCRATRRDHIHRRHRRLPVSAGGWTFSVAAPRWPRPPTGEGRRGRHPPRSAPKVCRQSPCEASHCGSRFHMMIDMIAIYFLSLQAHRRWPGGASGGHTLRTTADGRTLVTAHFGYTSRRRAGGPLRSADSQLRNAALTWAYEVLIRRPMPGRAVPGVLLQEPWTAAPC